MLTIVEEKVRPQRASDNRELYRRYWWQHAEKRVGLYRALSATVPPKRVFGRSLTSKHFAFAFLPEKIIYDQTLIVFVGLTLAESTVISSRVHESWAQFFGGTLEDRPRYNLADCFDPFPFPGPLDTSAGREYYEFRTELMIRNNQGLTKIYNRFHDPEEQSEDFKRLRALHQAMDRAVLDAYGWTDIQAVPEHEPEFDEEPAEDDEFSAAKKPKQKFRLRWPEEIRDDVLARLLILNEQRAAEEALEKKTKKKKSKRAATPLFDQGDKE